MSYYEVSYRELGVVRVAAIEAIDREAAELYVSEWPETETVIASKACTVEAALKLKSAGRCYTAKFGRRS